MLNKLKITLVVGVAIQVLRVFLPDLSVSGDFEAAVNGLVDVLFVIIPVAVGWFKKESQSNVDALVMG